MGDQPGWAGHHGCKLALTRALIRQLANDYESAASKAEGAADKFQQIDDARAKFTDNAADAFTGIVTGTISVRQALAGLAQDLARMATKKLFTGLLGGLVAGPAGSFLSLLGFDEGGHTGDGGKSVPAGIVHKGEYVMSAEATRKIGVWNLEALHSAAKRGYEGGGLVTGRGGTGALRERRCCERSTNHTHQFAHYRERFRRNTRAEQ